VPEAASERSRLRSLETAKAVVPIWAELIVIDRNPLNHDIAEI
jgi:hypothetical protein